MKKTMHCNPALILAPSLLGLMVSSALAQTVASPASKGEVQSLSTVVVTATGGSVDLRDAPASISVITREEIEKQPAQSLAQILSRVPGVSGGLGVSGEQSKIKLRGLPENYTLILVDGKRVGRSADTNYRPDLGRQDLDWITPELIERIEVVRGPMSSLYGSDAMGGVINIITRKIASVWSGSVTTSYNRPQHSDRGDAHQLGVQVSGPLTDTLGIRVAASVSRDNPDDVKDTNGGKAGWRNENLMATLNWKPAAGHDVALDVSTAVQRSLSSSTTVTGSNGNTSPVNAAWGAEKLTRTGVSLSHDGRWGFGTSKATFYHNEFKNHGADTQKSSDTVLEGSLNIPFTFGVDHMLTVGGQWKQEKLLNTDTIGTVPVDYDGNVVSGASLKGRTWAVFVEDEIFLRDNLSLTLGARMDHHQKYGNNISPRAYLVYHPTEAFTLRGGVSRGFRAPTLKENTGGAATQSRGNGCSGLIPLGYVSGGCYMAGNPNLEPETSTNVEFGVGYAANGWDLGLTYFHTNFKNKINYEPLGFYQGRWWTKMANAEKARTRGLEGSAAIPLVKDQLTWRTNFTWMMEAKNLSTGADLIATPKFTAYSALNWQVNERLYTELSAQYAGKQLGSGNTFTKSYTLFGLTAGYEVNKHLTLRAGVENLLDKKVQAAGSTNFYVPGRGFFVAATARF